MRLLWLCNMIPGQISAAMGKKTGSGLWVDHVLSDLQEMPDMILKVLCRGTEKSFGQAEAQLSYEIFTETKPEIYDPKLAQEFQKTLQGYQPDVIHIWGTEYCHTLAMVNAAESEGMLNRVVISVQGLCSVITGEYLADLPEQVCGSRTFRDILTGDNLHHQQKVFAQRGDLEIQALRKAKHVIGRTDWDYTWTEKYHPGRHYHFCNETLRAPFFSGKWEYTACSKHRILVSSCSYPIKGFHYLLDAMDEILRNYPDAEIVVPGSSFLQLNWKQRLRQRSYHRYLAKRAAPYAGKIHFLGHLSAEQMKEAMLHANVFALPSAIENSPNSLGEAMLLGLPCVAADVGGVRNLLLAPEEGVIYQNPSELASCICDVFAMEDAAEKMGARAAVHAAMTHNPEKNLQCLLDIYRDISAG